MDLIVISFRYKLRVNVVTLAGIRKGHRKHILRCCSHELVMQVGRL